MNHRRYDARLARLEKGRGGQEPTLILVQYDGDDRPSMGYRYWPDGRSEALTPVELAEAGRARPAREIGMTWGDGLEATRLIVDA